MQAAQQISCETTSIGWLMRGRMSTRRNDHCIGRLMQSPETFPSLQRDPPGKRLSSQELKVKLLEHLGLSCPSQPDFGLPWSHRQPTSQSISVGMNMCLCLITSSLSLPKLSQCGFAGNRIMPTLKQTTEAATKKRALKPIRRAMPPRKLLLQRACLGCCRLGLLK